MEKKPRKLAYTLWMQLKNKVFKGDWKATIGICMALLDVFVNFHRLLIESNRYSIKEYQNYCKLPPTKIYWQQQNEK